MKRVLPIVMLVACAAVQSAERYGIGNLATIDDIARWDIDIKPDGTGLPPGQGAVHEGVVLYRKLCLVCHGENGRNGQYDQLAGAPVPQEFATGGVRRTIGNYWPYAATLFDYIRRSMPQTQPGSLQDDEVYALVAYLLYLNNVVDADVIINSETLPQIRLPAESRFYWGDEVTHLR